ncbi:MAG: hypothetical protein KAR38_02595, partial [Calditrichia bacterium]|nr:hypothetical protein [Calditrichia bacterium]
MFSAIPSLSIINFRIMLPGGAISSYVLSLYLIITAFPLPAIILTLVLADIFFTVFLLQNVICCINKIYNFPYPA